MTSTDQRLGGVEERLGTLERRVNGIDQRLERVEGKQDAMLAWQQAHSERMTRLGELVTEIRDSLNGHGS